MKAVSSLCFGEVEQSHFLKLCNSGRAYVSNLCFLESSDCVSIGQELACNVPDKVALRPNVVDVMPKLVERLEKNVFCNRSDFSAIRDAMNALIKRVFQMWHTIFCSNFMWVVEALSRARAWVSPSTPSFVFE
jgi:hypothetical protein